MANDLTGTPWVLDTASNIPVQALASQTGSNTANPNMQLPANTVSSEPGHQASTYTGSTTQQVYRVKTTGFVFEAYTSGASSQAILKDGLRGVTVATLNGVTGNTAVGEAWFQPQWITNLTLSAIDSGHVKVIVR